LTFEVPRPCGPVHPHGALLVRALGAGGPKPTPLPRTHLQAIETNKFIQVCSSFLCQNGGHVEQPKWW
jgi:hypothetical protein